MGLDDTGERLVPERAEGYSFWEHVYRYRFALAFARGKAVVDIACGEGYGTAALATAARSVVGVDIAADAVEHARARYGVDARVGSATAVPLPDGCAEVVVSFETIEHVPSPAGFVRECHRVLAPGGLLVVSTPNRDVYSGAGHHNEFHVSELNEAEFAAVLRPHFTPVGWYGQCLTRGSWWRPRDVLVDGSPWVSVLPGRGVRKALRWALCPGLRRPPADGLRADPVRAVLGRDRPGAWWVNPYAVRRRWFGRPDAPGYFVAVARRADGPPSPGDTAAHPEAA